MPGFDKESHWVKLGVEHSMASIQNKTGFEPRDVSKNQLGLSKKIVI